ncbi:MAG: hypothetical protein JKY93_01880 [Gammaproteobacteria bacterium]|nr:hypothetical protein [Gammaproteobacteria bacterium]
MSEPKYNSEQIVFSLSSLVDVFLSQKGTKTQIEAYARDFVNKTLDNADIKALIGEWELAWGPSVYVADNESVADNIMYIAKSKSADNQYVVAIAGTNFMSRTNIIQEDLKLSPMKDWRYASGLDPVPKLSFGTDLGMSILLGLGNDQKQTISDYMKQVVAANAGAEDFTLTFAGHSLGGALSPAVALAMLDTQDDWDPKSIVDIRVEPSAGPTPGNGDWANYYDDRLGSKTKRLWNKLDIVPHAWNLDMLAQIPSLYSPPFGESTIVKALVVAAQVNSGVAGDMQQICADASPLQGDDVDKAILTDKSKVLQALKLISRTGLIGRVAEGVNLTSSEASKLNTAIDSLIAAVEQQGSNNVLVEAELESLIKVSIEASGIDISWWAKELLNLIIFLIIAMWQHVFAYFFLTGTLDFVRIVFTKIKTN